MWLTIIVQLLSHTVMSCLVCLIFLYRTRNVYLTISKVHKISEFSLRVLIFVQLTDQFTYYGFINVRWAFNFMNRTTKSNAHELLKIRPFFLLNSKCTNSKAIETVVYSETTKFNALQIKWITVEITPATNNIIVHSNKWTTYSYCIVYQHCPIGKI